MAWSFDVTSNIPRITQSGTDTNLDGILTAINAMGTVARSTAYAVTQMIKPPTPTGFWYRCSTAGTTSGTTPAYGTTLGGTTTDGTAVFTAFRAPEARWQGTGYLYNMPDVRVNITGTATNSNPQITSFVCWDLLLSAAGSNFTSGTWASDGVTPLYDGVHFIATRESINASDNSSGGLQLQAGAFTFIGGEVQVAGAIGLAAGTTPRTYYTRWRSVKQWSGVTTTRIRSYAIAAIFRQCEFYSIAYDLFRMPAEFSVKARKSEYVAQYVGSYAGGVDAYFKASALENVDGSYDFDNYSGGYVELFNCAKGANLNVTTQLPSNNMCTPLYQDVVITAKNTSGVAVQDVRFTATDAPTNSPTAIITTIAGLKSWDFRNALSYQATTDASGIANTSPILKVWYYASGLKQNLRFPSSTATFEGRSYNYKTMSASIILGSNSAQQLSAGVIALDTATTITETAALALTGISLVPIGSTGGTVTVNTNYDFSKVWEYYRAWISQFANTSSNDTWSCINLSLNFGNWALVVASGVSFTGTSLISAIRSSTSITNNGIISGIAIIAGDKPFITTGSGSVLTFNRSTVNWAPATYADQIRVGTGGTLNITNGTILTISQTAILGYGTALTAMFRSGSTLNFSDSTVIYNVPTNGSGTFFSNSEAGAIWNISNSVITLNCPNGAQIAIHAYFLPASVINGLTINGTATNVAWQMGYTTNNSKMVGFKYGGSILGNGSSNILMDTYTYTGASATIPNGYGAGNKWWWVDPVMQAGGIFRWGAGATPTGNSGFYGVIGFRPTISVDKIGYAPKVRFKPSAMATRYPEKTVQATQFGTIPVSEFFRDPTFMPETDGFLPFVDGLDDKTVLNNIDWTVDFRQNGFIGQSVTFTAANAKKGLITYAASGAVDSNYINDSTGAADALLITVNEITKELSATIGTLAWSAQRMYNALVNKWSSFAIETNIPANSTGGSLDLGAYTVKSSIRFVRGAVSDLVEQVRTTGIIESQNNEVPVADVNGSRASISGLDPQNFGITWYLRYKKVSGTTWTNSSGTGNTSQIVIDQDIYTVQVRVPGYDWKTTTFDATLSLSLELNLAYHVSANNTPQYMMSFDATLEASIQYDAAKMSVGVSNTTGAITQPGFAELYQATQRIQHIPALVWFWTNPVTANSTSQKILIPGGNPLSFFLTDASTASVKVTCPVIHADTGNSADDRVKGNTTGYSIILGSPATAESAGLQSAIVSDILAKIGGTGFIPDTHSLVNVKATVDALENYDDSELSAKVDAVKDVVDDLVNYDDTELVAKVDTIPTNPVLATDTRLDGIAQETTAQNIKTKVLTLNNYNDAALITKIDAIKSVVDSVKTTVEDKTGYTLTTAQVEAIATAVESHLLNEGDNKMLINAIVGAIDNANIDEVALVAAIRADLERTGGDLKAVKDKVDTLNNADFTATNAKIDAVKNVVDEITNYDDAELVAKVEAIPTNPVLTTDERLDGIAQESTVDALAQTISEEFDDLTEATDLTEVNQKLDELPEKVWDAL